MSKRPLRGLPAGSDAARDTPPAVPARAIDAPLSPSGRARAPHARLAWLQSVRPPFLLLALACVALGVACAVHSTPAGARAALGLPAGLALLAALSAHASVNLLNEWSDWRSGLDAQTQRTPFSGGSGTLPAHPHLAPVVGAAGVATLLLSAAIGLGFVLRWSDRWLLLAPLGLLGLALVASYTSWITRHPWLCLIAPGLGFGPLMVAGTAFALTGHYSATSLVAAAVTFCQANNLLLLNQFPDVDADRRVGRRTLPMVLGRPRCAAVLGAQALAAAAALLAGVASGVLPPAAASGLLTLPWAARSVQLAHRHADEPARLLPAMALNVAVCLLTPLLMAAGLVLG